MLRTRCRGGCAGLCRPSHGAVVGFEKPWPSVGDDPRWYLFSTEQFDDAVSELEAAVHAAVVRDDREALWRESAFGPFVLAARGP